MRILKCGDWEIEYILSRRAKKYINITIKNDGVIYVSAPKRVSINEVEKVIIEKKDFIKEKLEKIQNKNNKFKNDNCMWYKGLEYEIKFIESSEDKVEVFGKNLIINAKNREKEYTKKVIQKWIYDEARKTYNFEVKKWLEVLGEYDIDYPKIQIRKMTSRWGSCIPGKNKIALNTALMYVPVACMEYVVLHELVHFIEANHSKNFYSLIEKYMPDWNIRKNILNNEFGNIL